MIQRAVPPECVGVREGAGHEWRDDLGKKRRANGGCLGYPEARKDVVSCEKARGPANRD